MTDPGVDGQQSDLAYDNIWCKNIRVTGTLSVDGIMILGDAAADTLTVNGAATFANTVTLNGTVSTGLSMTGTYTNGIDLTSATMTQAIDNALFSIGSYTTAQAVVLTDSYIPMQVHLTTATSVDKTIAAEYLKVANTTDTALTQLCGSLVRIKLNGSVDSAYGVQTHINTGAVVAACDNVAAMSAKVDLDHAVTTSYAVQAGLFVCEGAGGVTGNSHGVQISVENGTTVDDGLFIGGSGTTTSAVVLHGTATYAFDISTSSGFSTNVATGDYGKIKVYVDGNAKYINVHNS